MISCEPHRWASRRVSLGTALRPGGNGVSPRDRSSEAGGSFVPVVALGPALIVAALGPALIVPALGPALIVAALGPALIVPLVSALIVAALILALIVSALVPALIVSALTPALIVSALVPALIVSPLVPALIVSALAPALIVSALVPVLIVAALLLALIDVATMTPGRPAVRRPSVPGLALVPRRAIDGCCPRMGHSEDRMLRRALHGPRGRGDTRRTFLRADRAHRQQKARGNRYRNRARHGNQFSGLAKRVHKERSDQIRLRG